MSRHTFKWPMNGPPIDLEVGDRFWLWNWSRRWWHFWKPRYVEYRVIETLERSPRP